MDTPPSPSKSTALRTILAPLAGAALLAALVSAPAHAATGGEPPHVEDGYTQPVYSYDDAVREHVMVESPVDSDGDGSNDLVRVDIVRPAESGPGLQVPTIIVNSPYFDNLGRGREAQNKAYGPDGEPAFFPLYYDNYFVPRGYAVLHVDMAGTTNSTGCPDVGGPGEVLGGKAVIDWLNGRADAYAPDGGPAAADWSDGQAGMIGKSWDGTVANGVAATGVDGLRTIVPISAISSWYRYMRLNGLVNFDGYAPYLAGLVDTSPEEDCAHVRDALEAGADDATGNYNDFWAERDFIDGTQGSAGQVQASVFAVHTVNDLNVKPDHFSLWWEALGAEGVDRKLWLGQYAHEEPFDFRREEWVDTLHRWFDHELYGVDNGIMDEPAVDVQTGPEEWTTQGTWPAPSPEAPLRPAGDGSLGLVPAAKGDTAEFTDARITEGAMVSDPQEEHPNRLAYVSRPLRTWMRLSGTPSMDLTVTVDQPTTPLTVLLVDYGETERVDYSTGGGLATLGERSCHGESSLEDSACYLTTETVTATEPVNVVARGWISAAHRDSLSDPEPMPVGEATRIQWDTLPQDYVFQPGNRLGLVIAGTDASYLSAQSQPGTGTQVTVDLAATSMSVPLRPHYRTGVQALDDSIFGPDDPDWTGPSDVVVPAQPHDFQ